MAKRDLQRYIPIDSKKLKEQLYKHDSNMSKFSVSIGRSESYVRDMAASGALNKSTVMLLEHAFGIKYDDIRPDDEPKHQEQLRMDCSCGKHENDFVEFFKIVKPQVINAICEFNENIKKNGGSAQLIEPSRTKYAILQSILFLLDNINVD